MATNSSTMDKVILFLSSRCLPKPPSCSRIDAFAVLFIKNGRSDQLTRVAHTSAVKDNANPDWAVPITCNYIFEVFQEVVVEVYHYNPKASVNDLTMHAQLGESRFLLADLMAKEQLTLNLAQCSTVNGSKSSSRSASRGNSTSTPPSAVGSNNASQLLVRVESLVSSRDLFCTSFQCDSLVNKDGFFGKSDPFLVISRLNEDSTYTVVWKSTRISGNLNPKWSLVKIPMSVLCNGDPHRPLKIEVFDWDANSKHKSMGEVETTVLKLLTDKGTLLPIIEPAVQRKQNGYTNSGTLVAQDAYIEKRPTFAEYIAGGLDISLAVGIDFTGSNGEPHLPNSLHYIAPPSAVDNTSTTETVRNGDTQKRACDTYFNPYEHTISSVGRILDVYDQSKQHPVFGFGAKVTMPDGNLSPVQHCFPVYGGGLYVHGIDGVLKAYHDCVRHVTLSGPTHFAQLISVAEHLAAQAQCSQAKQKYLILLIITDGVINDMEATKAALAKASLQPLYIIIVGVGAADFSSMDELLQCNGTNCGTSAGAGTKLLDNSVVEESRSTNSASTETTTTSGCKRDVNRRNIVQFVQFKSDQEASVLEEKLLREIPTQVLLYLESHNILPNRTVTSTGAPQAVPLN